MSQSPERGRSRPLPGYAATHGVAPRRSTLDVPAYVPVLRAGKGLSAGSGADPAYLTRSLKLWLQAGPLAGRIAEFDWQVKWRGSEGWPRG